jgi:MFS family permease
MLSARTIAAIVVGNALEWYDFIVYSFLTLYLAVLFFPSTNHVNSILAATATFGAAFIVRPIGGVLLGVYADRKGRKAAITLIIALMTLAIGLLAVVPTYASIGVFAPMLVLIARLLQGFSAGGEYGASTALLVELAPVGRKGFYGAFQTVGQMISILLGACTCLLMTKVLTKEQVLAWGWRLPFVVGLVIAPVGIYIRRHLSEAMLKERSEHLPFPMLLTTLKQRVKQMLIAVGLIVGGTTATYIHFSHMPTAMQLYFHIPMTTSYVVLIVAVCEMLILIPFFGALTDRVGTKHVLVGAVLSYSLIQYPLFVCIQKIPIFPVLLLAQCSVCIPLSALFGATPTALAQLFPVAIRSTSMSISYNFAVMLFGGFSPFLITWFVAKTGSPLAITIYLGFGFLISLVALIFYREKGCNDEHHAMAVAPHRI